MFAILCPCVLVVQLVKNSEASLSKNCRNIRQVIAIQQWEKHYLSSKEYFSQSRYIMNWAAICITPCQGRNPEVVVFRTKLLCRYRRLGSGLASNDTGWALKNLTKCHAYQSLNIVVPLFSETRSS